MVNEGKEVSNSTREFPKEDTRDFLALVVNVHTGRHLNILRKDILIVCERKVESIHSLAEKICVRPFPPFPVLKKLLSVCTDIVGARDKEL